MVQRLEVNQLDLPDRPRDGHKGTFGRVLVIGGSSGMSGAPALAGTAALRGGAGLVTVAVPADVQAIVASHEPSYITQALPVGDEAGAWLQKAAVQKNAIAIGPGLGQSEDAAVLVDAAVEHSGCPIVFDADALNILAKGGLAASQERRPWVLTPHPGEFSRLTGLLSREIHENREDVAAEFAARYGVVLVLKGAATVVTDGQRVFVNTTGNSGMATGGSGDVLTGLVTAIAAQSADLLNATALAVHLHGLAGDLAAQAVSERGLIASDLPRFIGAAWKVLEVRLSNP